MISVQNSFHSPPCLISPRLIYQVHRGRSKWGWEVFYSCSWRVQLPTIQQEVRNVHYWLLWTAINIIDKSLPSVVFLPETHKHVELNDTLTVVSGHDDADLYFAPLSPHLQLHDNYVFLISLVYLTSNPSFLKTSSKGQGWVPAPGPEMWISWQVDHRTSGW